MTQPTLESFFSGGGKSWSWKEKPLGTTISGTIKTVHPPQQVTDPNDGKLKFKQNGAPIMQVRIDLATNERDPSDPDDDGSRALYVGGWMIGALGDAMRKAGRQGTPEVGAQISVTLIDRTPNPEKPALAPTNKFSATYVPPAVAASDQLFNGATQVQYPPAPQYAQAPPQPQYSAPVVSTATGVPVVHQQAVPAPPQQQPVAPAAVQKPPQLSDEAWSQMPPAVQAQVAATMANLPPF